MHFSTLVASLALFAPVLATAQSSSWSNWGATTQYQATTTITMTLLQVNATVTSHIPKPTGFNATSSYAVSAATYNPATVNPSATPSVCSNCMSSSDASSEQINMGLAAVAGVAALAWASL